MNDSTTWREHLEGPKGSQDNIFSEEFLALADARTWTPGEPDQQAASQLHNQLISRISTHRLGYQAGVERTALDSIYSLFERTRQIVDDNDGCTHFETLAWHVLNEHVRPFLAKWHRRSEAGLLTALDTTDEFRAELARVQRALSAFDDVLLDLRGDGPAERSSNALGHLDRNETAVQKEVERPLPWGIPKSTMGRGAEKAICIQAVEASHVAKRRKHYELADTLHASGLALSGGGIRSATFAAGVMVALARRNLLPKFDFLSTVSGGGYIGSFLTAFLATSKAEEGELGLKKDQEPFLRTAGEARALRFVRHRCRYLLLGPPWRRLKFAVSQTYGMLLNALTVILCIGTIAALEHALRGVPGFDGAVAWTAIVLAAMLAAGGVLLPLLSRAPSVANVADAVVAAAALVTAGLFGWGLLGDVHTLVHSSPDALAWCAAAGVVPVLACILLALAGRKLGPFQIAVTIVAALAVPVFLATLELIFFDWLDGDAVRLFYFGAVPRLRIGEAVGGAAILACIGLDINYTSLHRFYRDRLAEAFFVTRRKDGALAQLPPERLAVSKALPESGPYHLLNCALNVPGSTDSAMQGRLTDFFLLSPCFTGSPLTGYWDTKDWEKQNPGLDLAAAMAISGAAAAPQMGILTNRRFSFWLALLNVRLGVWLRRPDRCGGRILKPGLLYLWREMLGTASERTACMNVSDGGHIENLGVYELLRRRCKFIIAVDGEHDPTMTFHGLTTLQRLAAIDLGIDIDFDLDDLRLMADGLSRSHFQFARIRYPAVDGFEKGTGYILYLKLSLTGNEGEFIKRYRLDEPSFPHHSTANQLFDETQFEAYRALGEHVGDKLFLEAIVGDLAKSENISLEELFAAIAMNFLQGDHPQRTNEEPTTALEASRSDTGPAPLSEPTGAGSDPDPDAGR